MIKKFFPSNSLEHLLVKAQDEAITFPEFMKIFLSSELIVPSASKVKNNGNIDPLFFDKEGQKMMSIFTSAGLLNLYKKTVKAYLVIKGRDILSQIPRGYGIVINPGYSVGFDISSNGIENILKEF